jgi:pimeloyl-ACP methyl ester carboxylesterase
LGIPFSRSDLESASARPELVSVEHTDSPDSAKSSVLQSQRPDTHIELPTLGLRATSRVSAQRRVVDSRHPAEPWRTIPSWALVGTEDRTITPDSLRFMAERAGSTIEEVKASHVSMISRPDAVTKLIETAAEATT